MKTYTLTIVFDEKTDTVEYIEEEMTEDTPTVMYKIEVDPEYYDEEVLERLIREGLIGES
jgi:hypothetical protein